MRFKKLKKLVAGVMTAAMVMSSMALTAFADVTPAVATIDTARKGSITIHKYEYNGTTTDKKGTGTTADASSLPTDAKKLEGVEFSVYQVMSQDEMLTYYNGSDTSNVTVDNFVEKSGNGYTVKNKNGGVIGTPIKTGTTNSEGVVAFNELPLGMYVVIESSAPDKVTIPANPFLVSVPMTNTDKTNWLYDIHVYPKNSTSEGNVTLKKTDKNGSPLPGVKFKLEKKNGENWDKQSTEVTTTETGEITWSSLAHGTYRITEVSAPAGYIVDERPIEFTVTNDNKIECSDTRSCISLGGTSGTKNLTITLKNEKPDVTKMIVDGSNETHEANAAIGSTVHYKVTVDVPKNITEMKTFVLTDNPTNLKDDISTITIENVDNSSNSVWDVIENGNGFIITFHPEEMGNWAGKKITVTYDATVLTSAATEEKALNTIDLEYSNKIHADGATPDDDNDKNHIKDSAIVYNFKIEVVKYKDSISDENKLGGVEFELYKGDSTTPIKVVMVSTGNYRLAVESDASENTTTTLVTDTNGKIVVTGLTDGTYYLKETKTADDYNLLKDKVEVNLNLDTVTIWTESSEFVGGVLVKRENASTTYKLDESTLAGNYVTKEIINKKGFDLPTTGGMGTFLFSLIGILLMACGAFVVFRTNRKKTA